MLQSYAEEGVTLEVTQTDEFLESGDVERHLHAFIYLTLDYRAHYTRRNTNNFWLIFRNAEFEVLDEINGDSLHLNKTVDNHEL